MGMVSYTPETLPKLSQEYLDSVAAIKDEDIDYSDIPYMGGAKLRPRTAADKAMYKPRKVSLTCRLDADIVAWLKEEGKGYQTRLNAILRHIMNSVQ
jgi:uncharacterized protein (DUF4415 family)